MSEAHLDFAFFGRDEDPQRTMAVLMARERTSRMQKRIPTSSVLGFLGFGFDSRFLGSGY